jgi:hypothetical protein
MWYITSLPRRLAFSSPFLEAFGLNAVYLMTPEHFVSSVHVRCNTSESPPVMKVSQYIARGVIFSGLRHMR